MTLLEEYKHILEELIAWYYETEASPALMSEYFGIPVRHSEELIDYFNEDKEIYG